jgi:hypothetical protein
MRRGIWIGTALTLLALLACNASVPSGTGPTAAPGETPAAGQRLPAVDGQPAEPGPDAAPPTGAQDTPNSQPVGFREGLASLDSYIVRIVMDFVGPSAQDHTRSEIETRRTREPDASMTITTTLARTEDEPDAAPSESASYRIGTEQCSGSDEDWTFDTLTPAQKELIDIFSEMLDLTPLIDGPQFVGSEVTSGVPTNRFVFQVSGLGVESGAEVVANQGEYWLAQDGQYIVRYSLLLETRSGPDREEVLRQEIAIDVSSINHAVEISFPPGCLAAKAGGP